MKKQTGITLITLIITIIIMLILAGVALSMAFGDQSVITQAQKAQESTTQAQKKEETTIKNYSDFVGYYDGTLRRKVSITPDNFDSTNFGKKNMEFILSGEFESLDIPTLGEGSSVSFDNVTTEKIVLPTEVTITGDNTINVTNNIIEVKSDESDAILNFENATLSSTNRYSINVTAPVGKSVLNITNSTLYLSTIFVGAHSLNYPNATAEFNVKNSYINCEENGLGSTIAIWGQSGVKSNIENSEIHTYSRGWHQSEDLNDNAITFQTGATNDITISKSNMHLYGARGVINARKYGSTSNYACNFNIDDSFIWVVSKSNNSPIYNATNINNSIVVSTKYAHSSNNTTTVESTVYGNPTIYGSFDITTQCNWAHDITIPSGQIVTFAQDSKVSIYEDAAEINFVGNIVNPGALTNIGIKEN